MDPQPSTSCIVHADSTIVSTKNTAQTAGSGKAMMVQLTTDGVPKLYCPVCDKALISLNGYVKHLKKHEPPGGFLCRYCDARFCSEDELKKHRNADHTTITCRICKDQQLTFLNEEEYREHIRGVHNGIDREIFKCEKCGAEYKTPEPFKRHQENNCGTIKPFKCDECEMAFYTKYNLKQHKITHSGERRFCCSYCGKNFLQKGRLVEHERSHTGEKPYKCDVCGKCFAHRESIVTHSSIHTGVKLVECRCCLSRFSCYSNLIKHRRSRPETCGLPEYNPPKNRVRTRRPRIPPTINPTSEIKVSNLNKIIKPSDKMLEKKSRRMKKDPEEVVDKSEAELTPKTKTRGKEKQQLPTGSEEDSMNEQNSSNDVEKEDKEFLILKKLPQRSTRKNIKEFIGIKIGSETNPVAFQETPSLSTSGSTTDALKDEKKKTWSYEADSAEEFPDFEPEYDELRNEKDYLKLPLPKLNIKKERPDEMAPTSTIKNTNESTTSGNYVSPELSVKSEDEQNIFNEKDKLLDCLLNDGQPQGGEGFCKAILDESDSSKLPSFAMVKVESLLDESEVVYIKDEHEGQMEDILNCNSDFTSDCKIVLEDVTHRYPKLKNDTSIKIARNTKPKLSLACRPQLKNARITKRKYRKRGEMPTKDEAKRPKRMAKLSQSQVKERLKLMNKEKSWQCPHCIKFYHIRKPFEKHLREEHKLEEIEIQKVFSDESQNGILGDDVFRCKICSKIYLVEKRLIAHVKLHGADGSLTHKCPCYCSIYFRTKEEALEHARQNHKDLLYCNICNKYMTGHDGLKNHRAIHHNDVKIGSQRNSQRNLVCDKCGRKYSSRTSLTDHVRSDCGRVPIYPCDICGKRLTTAGILKTHLLLHKDETPYQCDKCGKTFKVKAQYKSHLKTRHTDFKPFKCHLCPKEYPYRESLLTHMTVHTGIKRFLCNGCGKRFTCISNLQAHRKVHADSCGVLPLNARATQYMGVQKGNLLLGAKPEAGLDYKETNTLIAREVIDRDLPMAQEINYPSEPNAPLVTQPLNYAQPTPQLLLPQLMMTPFVNDSHSSY